MSTASKCYRSCNRDCAHKVYLDKILRITLKNFLDNRIGETGGKFSEYGLRFCVWPHRLCFHFFIPLWDYSNAESFFETLHGNLEGMTAKDRANGTAGNGCQG